MFIPRVTTQYCGSMLGEITQQHALLILTFQDRELGDGSRIKESTMTLSVQFSLPCLVQSCLDIMWLRIETGYLFKGNEAQVQLEDGWVPSSCFRWLAQWIQYRRQEVADFRKGTVDPLDIYLGAAILGVKTCLVYKMTLIMKMRVNLMLTYWVVICLIIQEGAGGWCGLGQMKISSKTF